nr:Ig-like domain-containing protein [uncultured Allomuricauda sp.]
MKYLIKTSLFLCFFLLILSCSSDSDEPTPEPDTTAPTVDFSIAGFTNASSSSPIVVSNQIQINIDANDSSGIQKVEAFINDEKVGEDTTAPYQIIVDVSGLASKNRQTGKFTDYTLRVVVTDISGNTSSKEQTFNVDNELPMVSEVSLESGTVINGDSNLVTFNVSDNEVLKEVKTFLNDELLSEIAGLNYQVNINTLNLQDGENILKIEAIDLADNTATFEVDFISDNTGPEISLNTITANDIIFQPVDLVPVVEDQYSPVLSLEVVYNENSLLLLEDSQNFNFNFDPDLYGVGDGIFELVATDGLGNVNTLTLPINIHRKLLTINIPEDRLNQAITTAVVFASNMDGSIITAKEILREDRQVVLSIPEEFEASREFMITFYLEDNGGAVSLSTHQNLTRSNLETVNLRPPSRLSGGNQIQVPINNFVSSDFVIGNSDISALDTHISSLSQSFYSAFLDTSNNVLNISTAELENSSNPFDSFYIYNPILGYTYLFIDRPVSENFIVNKEDLRTDNISQGTLNIVSGIQQSAPSFLEIFGAVSPSDSGSNKYHKIFNGGGASNSISYDLNTSFAEYRHSLLFENYFSARNGVPNQNYVVPDIVFDYSNTNNIISLNIQGDNHVLGRAQCIDFDNLTYEWHITFNSQSSSEIVIPDLPDLINNVVSQVQQNQNIKVESVELYSYESIVNYDDYLDKVVKNQANVLDVTDWYQLIFSSRTGNFNRPNREFIFQ